MEELLNLVSTRTPSKRKTEMLEKVETMQGYDLVFILSLITQNNYSGNLIVVNDDNDLSGITFIYGDIVKVDYPDDKHLLGNLIVQYEIISKYEMQEIVEKCGTARLGDYLLEEGLLTEAQLRKILFRQTALRLGKYLSDKSLRVKFSFDGESSHSILINKIDYRDILYEWVFKEFKDDWFDGYNEIYREADTRFYSNIGPEELQFLKDYPEVYDLAFRIAHSKNQIFTYHELFVGAQRTIQKLKKILHFLVLAGILSYGRAKDRNAESTRKSGEALQISMDSDLLRSKELLLQKKYFEAFGVLNQYSRYQTTDNRVHFYFIWIKLIGVYEHKHIIDAEKISKEFYDLDHFSLDPGEFYYVRALLLAVQERYRESDEAYLRAVESDPIYGAYPLNKEDNSFLDRILKFFGRLNIDKN